MSGPRLAVYYTPQGPSVVEQSMVIFETRNEVSTCGSPHVKVKLSKGLRRRHDQRNQGGPNDEPRVCLNSLSGCTSSRRAYVEYLLSVKVVGVLDRSNFKVIVFACKLDACFACVDSTRTR